MGTYYAIDNHDELYHHGVQGMKWGVRRYQHEDGTRTALGKKHEATLGDGGNSGPRTSFGKRREAKKAYRASVKAAKKAKRAREDEYINDYFRNLEGIEKGYKRGQNLSEKDQERERRLGAKLEKDFEDSKKSFKDEKAAAKAKLKEDKERIKSESNSSMRKEARRNYKEAVKNAKKSKRDREGKMMDDYFRELEGIEKGYKRGQNLSEKDLAREKKLADKTNKGYEKSAKQYRDERAAAKAKYQEAKANIRRRSDTVGRATLEGGLVGRALYKNKHAGERSSNKSNPREAKQVRIKSSRESREKSFAAKRGMTSADYNATMNSVDAYYAKKRKKR